MSIDDVNVVRVRTPEQYEFALRIVDEVYVQERGWMDRPDLDNFPPGSNVSWFLATVGGEPAALMRVLYDPTVRAPRSGDAGTSPAPLRVAEVGRLMLAEPFRGRRRVVLRLLGACTREVVGRGYSHLLTELLEGNPRSPYALPARMLGFEPIGTQRRGGMRNDPERVVLLLDIERAVRRLGARGGRFFRDFTEGYLDVLENRYGPLMPLERAVS